MNNIKNDEIMELESKISETEANIESLKAELVKENEKLNSFKERLKFLESGGNDSLPIGSKIYFIDKYQKELELIVVSDYRGLYSAVLMTDYTEYSKDMSEFYLFKMDCIYSDDLIKELEKEYNWKFIEAKGPKE